MTAKAMIRPVVWTPREAALSTAPLDVVPGRNLAGKIATRCPGTNQGQAVGLMTPAEFALRRRCLSPAGNPPLPLQRAGCQS